MSNRTFYASTYVVADGVTRTWPFSFAGVETGQESGTTPYLYPEDVKVQEIFTDTDGNKQTVQRTGVLNSPNQMTIDGPAVLVGREIRIYRETELRFPLVDYRDLQSVSEHDLDLANRQAVFIAQETRDTASANLMYDNQGHFNALGRRIVNLAPGIDEKDAVNVSQLRHSVRVPETEPEVEALPPAEQRAGRFLTFDAAGKPVAALPNTGSTEALTSLLASPDGGKQIGSAGPEATVQEALDNRVVGDPGQRYSIIAGAFRKDLAESPVWAGIFDRTHRPIRMIEPIEAATELHLRYPGNSNIGSMAVVPDERFAAYGVTVGASVGKEDCYVRMGAPCEYAVSFSAPFTVTSPGIVVDERLFGKQRFTAQVADTGLITLGHPQLQGKAQPTIQYRAPRSTDPLAHPHVVTTNSPGQTTLFLVGRMSGRIRFDGTRWGTAFSPYNSLITGEYDSKTGELKVTHPGLTGNNAPQATVSTSVNVKDSYLVSEVGASDTSFIVRFRKAVDDSIPETIPEGVGITFDRGMTALLPKSAITGSITVFLDVVQLDIRDVNFPLANLWALGIMGRDQL